MHQTLLQHTLVFQDEEEKEEQEDVSGAGQTP